MGKFIAKWFKRYWPSTLRLQLMIILLPVVGLPIIFTGYLLQLSGRNALVEEKRAYLQGVTVLLDQYLQNAGGYKALLAAFPGENDDRTGRIFFLNNRLRTYTDEMAEAFAGIGVGYFCLELDSIITYGPSRLYDKTVGITIPRDHPGWQVMASGKPMTVSGGQVRGNIMNVMHPIKENGQVTGYIWANEFLDDIDRQVRQMHLAVYSMTLLGFLLSLAVIYFVIRQLSSRLGKIKLGLEKLRFDLRETLPQIGGEIGIISEEINKLARSLLETRSMHNNILDSLSDAVITIDMQGRISYINPAGCTLFQCRTNETIGASYLQLFNADEHLLTLMIQAMQSMHEYRGIELDYALSGQTLRILVSTGRFYDGRGNQLGVVAVVRNISETFLLRQQVMRADRLAAIGKVVASIAHELRTPLTSIRGFMQYLQGSINPAEWKEYGNIIIREVDGLNRIVSELLDLVRKKTPHMQACDLNQLIEETCLLVCDNTTPRKISFVLDLDENLPEVELDRGQIKQVLLDIIINAIESIDEEGEVRVATMLQSADTICVMVQDNGCGIAAEIVEKIFDPFFSTKSSGTGLGMTIAKQIIENHHGCIQIQSVQTRGSTIKLILPLYSDRRIHESRIPDIDRR